MRRKAAPGWLGADTPEHFIQTVHINDEMPCHQTVDYSDPEWELRLGEATACAGVAIYHENVSKLPRDRQVRRLQGDMKNVFASPREFIAHHSKGPRWNEAKQSFDAPKRRAPAKERKARLKVR